MTKDNNRNSRDDKSKPGNRSTTGRRPSGTESSYKGKSKFEDKEGRDKKEYKPREGDNKEFKPRADKDSKDNFRPRSTNGEFKSRNNNDRDFKPRTGERKEFSPRDGEKKDFKPRDGERREFKPRDGEKRDFKPRDGERREFKPRDTEKKEFKPRAFKEGSSRETPPGEKRSYIKKDNFGTGDKPFRKFDESKSSTSRSTDSRPFRKRDAEGGKPTFQDRGERVENAPSMRNRRS